MKKRRSLVLTITRRHSSPNSRKSKIIKAEEESQEVSNNVFQIEMRTVPEVAFEGRQYIIDHSERLIGTLVDVYENGKVIYIDRDVPERFFEGLALSELVTRKFLKKGMGWSEASDEANRAEKDYYVSKYGPAEGAELFNDELKFQAWKFEQEKKELKEEGGHKVIYEKGEILPK